MVAFVVHTSFWVGRDVKLEVPHHEGPQTPRHEVLDAEGPPEDKYTGPPLLVTHESLIRAFDDLFSQLIGPVEEHFLIPVNNVLVFFKGKGKSYGDTSDCPED